MRRHPASLRTRLFAGFLAAVPGGLIGSASLQNAEPRDFQEFRMETDVPVRMILPGLAGWIDTGWDVTEEEEIVFSATGRISLQVGNPVAVCGPDGYDMRSVQQPLRDENIGALIGKVVQLVGIQKDEETGEEIREEIVRYFMIGSSARVKIPLSGRLHLGINENVFEDNAGAFTVDLARFRRERPEIFP